MNGPLSMALLEPVLARHPDNTGAIHFYIHASEIAGVPARAERHAERLAALAPRGSHLVHMPSHTFFWVGRYQDAANANRRAVDIDEENALAAAAAGAAPDTSYNAHNISFGLAGALMAGDAELALRLGRPTGTRT